MALDLVVEFVFIFLLLVVELLTARMEIRKWLNVEIQ